MNGKIEEKALIYLPVYKICKSEPIERDMRWDTNLQKWAYPDGERFYTYNESVWFNVGGKLIPHSQKGYLYNNDLKEGEKVFLFFHDSVRDGYWVESASPTEIIDYEMQMEGSLFGYVVDCNIPQNSTYRGNMRGFIVSRYFDAKVEFYFDLPYKFEFPYNMDGVVLVTFKNCTIKSERCSNSLRGTLSNNTIIDFYRWSGRARVIK